MKRLTKIIILIITIFISTNVYAKDTVYSIGKYKDEEFKLIQESYNALGKRDGIVTSGTYIKEKVEKDDTEYDNYQIMLVKYKKSGKVSWTYRYGRTSSESIDALIYSYDENNNVDGYIMVVSNSYDILTTNDSKSYFVKIDLNGKLVYEKETSLNTDEIINKIIPTYSIDNIVDGYIGITNNSIIKYDKDLNLVLKKDYQNSNYLSTTYTDISNINENSIITGYVLIRKLETENNKYNVEVIKYNESLSEETLIKENINNYKSYNLEEANNGFILYGITDDVKVKKGNSSYYIINYNTNGEEIWESIGSVGLKENTNVILHSRKKKHISNYFLLYKNIDNSNEIIRLDNEGLLEKKIKKINNDYYNFISFIVDNNEKVYFVGQMKCPEDEKCDYETNSLLLISDEDKVIEVQDSTSTSILVSIFVILILIGTAIYLVKSKGMKNKKK